MNLLYALSFLLFHLHFFSHLLVTAQNLSQTNMRHGLDVGLGSSLDLFWSNISWPFNPKLERPGINFKFSKAIFHAKQEAKLAFPPPSCWRTSTSLFTNL